MHLTKNKYLYAIEGWELFVFCNDQLWHEVDENADAYLFTGEECVMAECLPGWADGCYFAGPGEYNDYDE